jgi:hypothetical protein
MAFAGPAVSQRVLGMLAILRISRVPRENGRWFGQSQVIIARAEIVDLQARDLD